MRTKEATRGNVLRRLSVTSAAGLCGLFAQTALAQTALTEKALCKVEAVYGQAEIVKDAARSALADGSPVAVKDQIETGVDSRVTLLCPEDLRITIGPASEVVLAEVDEGSTGWAAILPRGIAQFARPLFGGARFEVRTPSAVASVRSTVWMVEVDKGATAVFVQEGAVDVTAASGTALLEAGSGVDVSAEGRLGASGVWTQERIDQITKRLAIPAQ